MFHLVNCQGQNTHFVNFFQKNVLEYQCKFTIKEFIMKTRIKELRKLFGMTQEELSKKLNFGRPTICNYEKENREPSFEKLKIIADFFKVTVNFLINEDNRPIKQYKEWSRFEQIKFDEATTEEEKWELTYEYSGLKELMSANNTIFERFENIKPVELVKIPLLGKIACGEPIWANEERDNYIMAGTNVKADFCLICEGDSMINARILDGDIVFIRQQNMVENGEIAAVIIEDSVTLKRVYYYPEQAKIILQAENPKYQPFIYSNEELNNIRILGKAIEFQSKVR